jgi:hypothetical protein
MHRRLIAIAMLLATVLQGPALTYAATLGSSSIADAITHACSGQALPDGTDCDTCCSHGAMPSCAAQCPVPFGAAVPLTFPTVLRIAARGVLIPEAGIAPFVDHDPPHPLRPPIV